MSSTTAAPGDLLTPLLAGADKAVYAAKAGGRNRAECAEARIDPAGADPGH